MATCSLASKPYVFDAPGHNHEGCSRKSFMLFHSTDQKANYFSAQKKCALLPGGKLAAINSANIGYIANNVHRVIGNEYDVACWIGSWNTDHYRGCIALGQGLHIGQYPDEPRAFLCEFCADTPICDLDPSCKCRRSLYECNDLEDKCCKKHHNCRCPDLYFPDNCPCNRRRHGRHEPYEEIRFTEDFEIEYDRRIRPASSNPDEIIYDNATDIIKEVIVDKPEDNQGL